MYGRANSAVAAARMTIHFTTTSCRMYARPSRIDSSIVTAPLVPMIGTGRMRNSATTTARYEIALM